MLERVGVVDGDADREARLSHAGRSYERYERDVVAQEERADLLGVAVATDERPRLRKAARDCTGPARTRRRPAGGILEPFAVGLGEPERLGDEHYGD